MMDGSRRSVKDVTPSWKQNLRNECFKRLGKERNKILWAHRDRDNEREHVQEALRGVIDGVYASLAPNTTTPPNRTGSVGDRDQGTALTPHRLDDSFTYALAPAPFPLNPAEYEELMQALEASLYEDMLREEAEYLEALEQQDIEQMVENYYTSGAPPLAADDSSPSPDSSTDRVLCPICEHAFLTEHKGVILCPSKDLRLDATYENLTLEDLRGRLATALVEHRDGGCLGKPTFQMHDFQETKMLQMTCVHCNALSVIL